MVRVINVPERERNSNFIVKGGKSGRLEGMRDRHGKRERERERERRLEVIASTSGSHVQCRRNSMLSLTYINELNSFQQVRVAH